MALKKYAKPFWEAYAIFDCLRHFGFKSDDIYVGFDFIGGLGHDVLFVQLQSGEKRFVVPAGKLHGASRSSVLESWQTFCQEVRRANQHALERVLSRTVYGTDPRAVGILGASLEKHGFRVKKLGN